MREALLITRSVMMVCAGLGALTFTALAQEPAPSAQPTTATQDATSLIAHPDRELPWDPRVRRGALKNGMRYFIEANAHPAARAELRLVVDAGSVLEDDDQLGLAHFVEHMAFNGSAHFKGNELISTLERFGMSFGAHLNAYTSFDETVYQLQVPTTKTELDAALLILHDWAGGVSFESTEIEKERGVVLDEWRGGLGAGRRLQDRLIPLQFNHSRYADRLPIGTESSLKGFKRESLMRFYRDWYRPSLMTLIIVGDIDVNAVEAQVKARFSDLKEPQTPRDRTRVSVAPYQAPVSAVLTDPELPTIAIQLSEIIEHREPKTRGEYRDGYLGDIALMILNERLGELRKQPQPPFMMAQAHESLLTLDRASRGLAVIPIGEEIKPALIAALAELRRAQLHGVSRAELDRAQRVLLSYLDRLIQQERTEESDGAADELVRHATRGEPVPGLKAEAELVREVASTVKLEEINAKLLELLSGGGWAVALMAPKESAASLPSEGELLAWVREGLALKPQANSVEAEDESPLVARPPTPGRVIKESRDELTDTVIWDLSNGARIVLKRTDFEDQTAMMSAFKWGGTSLASDADYIPASQASGLAARSGLGSFDSSALSKRLAGAQASVSLDISELEVSLSASSSLNDLDLMFELLWLKATAPRIDDDVFTRHITELREDLKRRGLNPDVRVSDRYYQLMWSDHPRRKPLNQADIDQADLERSRAFLRSQVADWSGATFVFVGDFDIAQLKPKVERWIGGLPGSPERASAAHFNNVNARVSLEAHREVVRRGLEPKAEVIISLTGRFENQPKARYSLRALSQLLSLRLREELRERQGGTYSVSADASITELPSGEYTITTAFGCDPSRAEELTAIAWGILKGSRTDAASPEELEKIKNAQLRSHEVNMKSNAYWLGALTSNQRRAAEPSAALLEYWALPERLTAAQLLETAQRYVIPEQSVQLTALPEVKPSAQPDPQP